MSNLITAKMKKLTRLDVWVTGAGKYRGACGADQIKLPAKVPLQGPVGGPIEDAGSCS